MEKTASPYQIPSHEQTRLYYKELFDNLLLKKKVFLVACLFMFVVDFLESYLICSHHFGISKRSSFTKLVYLYFVLCFLLYYFAIFARYGCSESKTYRFRFFLLALANIMFAAARIINGIALIDYTINSSNNTSQWLYQCVSFLNQTYACFIADIFNPTWLLKLLIPMSAYIPLFHAYYSSDSSGMAFLWVRFWTITIYLTLMFYFKNHSQWISFQNKLNLESWASLYKTMLDKSSDATALLNLEGQPIYQNLEFSRLCFSGIDDLMTKLVDLKRSKPVEQLTTEYTTVTLKNETKHRDDEEVNKIIPVTPRSSTKGTLSTRNEFANLGELFSYAQEALISRIFFPDDCFAFQAKYTGFVLRDPEENAPYQTTMFEIRIIPLVDYNRFILVLTDITHRELSINLESQNSYKEKLLATVSHDFRTPLNASLNFLESSLTEAAIPQSTKDQLLVPAYRSCKILLHLVNDMLDFSQINAQKLRLAFEKLSIIETIQNCHQLLEVQAQKKGLNFPLILDPNLPQQFNTDHSRLSQILLNLLSNAVKFTFRGEVRLTVISLGGGLVQMEVSDTGIGIQEDDQARLFQPYTRIDHHQASEINSRGIGLGLMIANKLASQLGPNENSGIKVSSQYGHGTNFVFCLQEKELKTPSTVAPITLKFRKETALSGSNCDTPKMIRVDTTSSAPPDEFLESKLYPLTHHPGKTLSHIVHLDNVSRKQSIFNNVKSVHSNITSLQTPKAIHMNSNNTHNRTSIRVQETPLAINGKVLVVDDDPLNIMVLEKLLLNLGVSADCASNGQEALEKLKKSCGCERECPHRWKPKYRMIFMDCQMPVMDGFQACKHINEMISKKEINPIPIIGCTGNEGFNIEEQCKNVGMNEMITKPISKETLDEVFSKYI